MADSAEQLVAVVVRVGTPGQPAFQLRKGERGISVFGPDLVDPPLTEAEILEAFRPGSIVIYLPVARIADLKLELVQSPGADALPPRLQAAHAEIRPGPVMPRAAFKAALKDLE